VNDFMDSVHHIWCPLFSQEFQDLPDGTETTLTEIMRATVFNYIECDYNRWRRHSWCGGLSPEQFENQNLA
ncbi:IS3 family transposase, partial [Escherichia coli]|uniref:IS3 family transposase n=1 Tax=Escherichia coli TaxID=562 RepID=UPI00201A9B54